MKQLDKLTTIREARGSDLNFILSSWLKSSRNHPFLRKMGNDAYFSKYQKMIKTLLADSKVLILCSKDDEDQILGYLIYTSEGIIHYLYVKYTYRKMGFAKYLFDSVKTIEPRISTTTHVTPKLEKRILDTGLSYDPFILCKYVTEESA